MAMRMTMTNAEMYMSIFLNAVETSEPWGVFRAVAEAAPVDGLAYERSKLTMVPRPPVLSSLVRHLTRAYTNLAPGGIETNKSADHAVALHVFLKSLALRTAKFISKGLIRIVPTFF